MTSLVEVHAPAWLVAVVVRAQGTSDTRKVLESHLDQMAFRLAQLFGPPRAGAAAGAGLA